PRGRKAGEGRTLTPALASDLFGSMAECAPDSVKGISIKSSLWSADAVRALIEQRHGMDISARTVARYLKQWGLQLQSSMPMAVRPGIAAPAQSEGAVLLQGGVSRAVVAEASSRSVLFAVDGRGRSEWLFHGEPLNGQQLIDFFNRLTISRDRKILMCMS